MVRVAAIFIILFAGILVNPVLAQDSSDSLTVLKAFAEEKKESDIVKIEQKTKHQIMFYMAVPLLLLLIATVALGVAMAVFGKQVFLAHMICAGLSLTLALAHSVVGIVWFFPW